MGHFFGPFSPYLGKTGFSSRFCSYQFFLILTKYHCVKFKKKNKKTNERIPSNTDFCPFETYCPQWWQLEKERKPFSGQAHFPEILPTFS